MSDESDGGSVNDSQENGLPRLSSELSDDPHETLIQLLSTLPTIITSTPTPIGDGSRMAADRDAVSDINLPRVCQHYISVANDFLVTLEQILAADSGRVQIPRYSAYPLIRGVIEHAGQAAWILGPDDQRQRFTRLLQVQKSEMDYDRRYIDATSSSAHIHEDDTAEMRSQINEVQREASSARDRRMQRLLDIAAAFGVDRSEFERGLGGGYEAVVDQAFSEAHLTDGQSANESHWIGRYAASMWMFVSGLSHPSESRAWAGTENYRPDGTLVVVETAANPIITRNALLVALRLQMRAITLWKWACTP